MNRKKRGTILNSNENNHNPYQAIDELASALDEEERSKYADILRSMKLPMSAYEECSSWSQKSYTRNCILENEQFELILLCWEKGQKTAIHDHGGEECWVKIIQGELRETIYTLDEKGELTELGSSVAKKNDITYMVDFMGTHCLENLSDARSMSLHLYAKPIRSCNAYDETSEKFVNRDLVYTTVLDFTEKIKTHV